MPMKFIISSEFGAVEKIRDNVPHNGIDIVIPEGTKLRPIMDGIVERIVHNDVVGNGVVIRAADGTHHSYGHLSEITVRLHDHVTAGKSIIGLSGNTGHSTGPHLHFAVQAPDGKFLDPSPVIPQLSDVTGDISWWDRFWQSGVGDGLNQVGDTFVQKEVDWILRPIGLFLKHCAIYMGEWIVFHIPDILGYGAIFTGVCMIFGSMVGKGGMIKPLAIYLGVFTVGVLIRGGTT